MKGLIARFAAVTALCAMPMTPAFAQWSAKGEIGIALNSGNSDAKSGNAKLEVGRKLDNWQYSFGTAGNYVSDATGTTARRFEVSGQSRYQFNPRDFWYGGARYENDRFSGFKYQATVSSGVGRRFIDNDTTQFNGQIGLGGKFLETRDAVGGTTQTPGEAHVSAALVGSTDYSHKLTDTTTVFDKLGYEVATRNKFMQNEVGVAVKMFNRMGMQVAFALRHNTQPPSGFRKTDTLTTVNLVYEVK